MLTVPEAARRAGRTPETLRRWIRSGRLRSRKVGSQHVIEERDLERLVEEQQTIEVPAGISRGEDGRAQPDWVALVREQREAH